MKNNTPFHELIEKAKQITFPDYFNAYLSVWDRLKTYFPNGNVSTLKRATLWGTLRLIV